MTMGPGSISDQGTRYRILQWTATKSSHATTEDPHATTKIEDPKKKKQLKILWAVAKTQCSQIHIYLIYTLVSPLMICLTLVRKVYFLDSQCKFAAWLRELKLGLCDKLEGWDAIAGRSKREGTYIYLWQTHVDIWQKPTPYCKAVILEFKINNLKKRKACIFRRET